MQIVMQFGDSAAKASGKTGYYASYNAITKLEIATEEMSPEGRADYTAALEKTEAPMARRAMLIPEIESRMEGFSFNEKAALRSLIDQPCHLTKLAAKQLCFMRNSDAIAYATQLIDCNLPIASARRDMAIIARSEFYDLKVRKAKETKAGFKKEHAELAATGKTDEDTAQKLRSLEMYLAVDLVKTNLEALKKFDKGFLSDFNGYMLETIQSLKEMQLKFAAKAALTAQKAINTGQKPALQALSLS